MDMFSQLAHVDTPLAGVIPVAFLVALKVIVSDTLKDLYNLKPISQLFSDLGLARFMMELMCVALLITNVLSRYDDPGNLAGLIATFIVSAILFKYLLLGVSEFFYAKPSKRDIVPRNPQG